MSCPYYCKLQLSQFVSVIFEKMYVHQDEAAIVVNMSAEDLQQKYNGNLSSEMIGPLHNLIAKVSEDSGHTVTLIFFVGFVFHARTSARAPTNRCSPFEHDPWLFCR